jgi:cytochrome c peroxidase
MKKGAIAVFSLFETLRFPVAGLALIFFLDGPPQPAWAQTAKSNDPAQSRAWAPGAIDHAQKMRVFKDADRGAQPTPAVIPRFEVDNDPSGKIATFQPGGPTSTTFNAFFQNLGTNGRTCFSCHQPQEGWTVSSAGVSARFEASGGTDPIFRLIDGATCPSDDVSTIGAKREAFKLVIDKGLIRIGLPMPAANLQFAVTEVEDPYHCTTNPKTGLTSPTTGTVSVYRRPLPSTNVGFLATIMWDGREPSPAKFGLSNGLSQQAIDATRIHAEANADPTADQQAQIVAFQKGIFTAQDFDNAAHNLHVRNATGGPAALSAELSKFFLGINDPVGLNPTGASFNPNIFDLYKYWQGLRDASSETERRKSVARGEEVFNTTKINITGVAGLNDDLNKPSIPGFCGTCHDTPNVGNHSVSAPLDIGIADAGPKAPPALDISGLPVFTLTCTQGPLAGTIYTVTDPGRALISGQCKDIGRVKGPILRGLAARAPYFHNGSAATLLDAVNFYDQRFGIGFTDQQKEDLVNFLKTL